MNRQLLRIDEVTDLVRLSRATIYRAIRHDRFPRPVKFGSSAFWRSGDVQAWLDALASTPPAEA